MRAWSQGSIGQGQPCTCLLLKSSTPTKAAMAPHMPTEQVACNCCKVLHDLSKTSLIAADVRRLQACTVSAVPNNIGEMLTLCSSPQTGTCGTVARFSPPCRLLPLPSPSSRCSSLERSTSSATGCPFAARRRPAAWSTGLEAGAWSQYVQLWCHSTLEAGACWNTQSCHTNRRKPRKICVFCYSLVSFKNQKPVPRGEQRQWHPSSTYMGQETEAQTTVGTGAKAASRPPEASPMCGWQCKLPYFIAAEHP